MSTWLIVEQLSTGVLSIQGLNAYAVETFGESKEITDSHD